MSCTNCFNGCSEITSDKCVKYTGADIPALGIQNGDTLEFVEQTLAQFLISTLNGTGIKPIVDLEGVCSIVANNIPPCVGCAGPTLNDLLQALIDSACDLQDLVNNVTNNLEILEGPYNEGCLTVEETTFSNTHNVLQAVIDQLCQTDELLETTILSLNNYVLEDELSNLVVNILEDEGLVGTTTKQYTKMVPYVAVPWFPTTALLNNFTNTGAGIVGSEYENIYFCNGLNGTPDLRGRVLAGVTNGMGGNTLPPDVNPSSNTLNPNYTLGASFGTNFVTLGIPQIPTHTHTATAVSEVSPNPHTHTGVAAGPYVGSNIAGGGGFGGGSNDWKNRPFTTASTSLSVDTTLTIDPTGQNQAHQNNQPTIGCYYIMYIPA
jgi:microcystin-dependent protein